MVISTYLLYHQNTWFGPILIIFVKSFRMQDNS